MSEPTPSATYKLTPPENVSKHAVYFTVEGDPIDALFINSKEMDSFQWIIFSMTQISRQLQSGTDIADIIMDMKETFDPNGEYIIPGKSGVKVASLVNHLGLLLEKHVAYMKEKHNQRRGDCESKKMANY